LALHFGLRVLEAVLGKTTVLFININLKSLGTVAEPKSIENHKFTTKVLYFLLWIILFFLVITVAGTAALFLRSIGVFV